ncbi:MAG: adenylosuccinate synthase [Ignavibacteria bacterium]|nr:adenylosuccinate synthase [Bacteroidota bacterium]MSQ45996.1 adenylosuccinate synthase [Ignavibacteria bacterium]
MPVTIIVGTQWGDEGKGKIVDQISKNINIVARYQGGANAGHTIIVDEKEVVLHLIPSGIFHPHVTCVIGNGVVLDPVALMQEIKMVESLGVKIGNRLRISHNAHLIMPYHKLLDSLREQSSTKIGTTGRGIGPAYIDKYMRTGIRVVDLLDRNTLREKLISNLEEKNKLLKNIYSTKELDVEEMIRTYQDFDKKIDSYVTDTSQFLNNELRKGKKVLAEGAQGSLLDVDHGTYPFVTSSNPTSGGACTGLGIPPTSVTKIIGIVKAYSTRVGNGPFPTELENEIGEKLRSIGHEFGATTGRPRRCGWLDIFSLNYSLKINGVDEIALTKLDVLSSFEEILICTGYEVNGKMIANFPTDIRTLDNAKPIFTSFKGWRDDITGIKKFILLPKECRKYIRAIEKLTNTKITFVSVGPRRSQTIIRK